MTAGVGCALVGCKDTNGPWVPVKELNGFLCEDHYDIIVLHGITAKLPLIARTITKVAEFFANTAQTHKSSCQMWVPGSHARPGVPKTCTCGLDEALALLSALQLMDLSWVSSHLKS